MSFNEKSAWVMVVAFSLAGLLYFNIVSARAEGWLDLPSSLVVEGVIAITMFIALAIAGHILAAISRPSEADAAADERDRMISDRAAHWSGNQLGIGVIVALGAYLATGNGNLMFYLCLASLFVAQIVEYLFRVILYRRG